MKQNKKAKICFVIYIAGKKKLLFYIYAVIVKQKKTELCRIYYSPTQWRRVRAAIQTQNEWSGGPEAGTLGAGSVGVGC
jgi:hypothetical protein